jgi:hypothetical protein
MLSAVIHRGIGRRIASGWSNALGQRRKDRFMKLSWTLASTLAFSLLSAAQARAAVVAVMPVRGVNLSEGQCDAIGVLFANAFAHDSQVAVASPLETRPALVQSKTSVAVAARLGVAEYVELRAIQLGKRITLAGIIYGKDGREIFRAETAAPGLDDMELAAARLAHALILREPIPSRPLPETGTEAPEVASTPEGGVAVAAEPSVRPTAFGVKTGLIFPMASGRSFFPMLSLQFDGRIGTRNHFLEFGLGGAVPTDSQGSSDTVGLFAFFGEIGGSIYLSDGSIAPYIGGGISPGIWVYDRMSSTSDSGLRCAIYGQAGITFTRDSRTKIYAEFRVSQHILGFADQVNDYSTYGMTASGSYYPTLLALQFGLGW